MEEGVAGAAAAVAAAAAAAAGVGWCSGEEGCVGDEEGDKWGFLTQLLMGLRYREVGIN